ncbi:MarR family winged helix-turn-helix transcriptional regulator [Segeticoccus rhizosphaerae]|jgi:DNA-binding MarR family transcriptional regulator|uniref:MarR family winged helix-turn-helix transcriptional regulator n=1 Tax=Segeticoccus rhizosphaerae TaxID=1104777 RepID=UPI0010C00866|nr:MULTISPECIES: MarR family transcriptional regulator [Intrasporangiaceae]
MPVNVAEAGQLSVSLIRLMKLMKSIRTHAPRPHPAIESAAYPIMFTLVEGPQRVSRLADAVHSDVSTVSRQTSALAELGLLGKVQDPDDGRVWMLSLTAEGQELVQRLKEQRAEWFSYLLQDWDHADVVAFARSVDRLTTACDRERQRFMASAVDSTGARVATADETPAATPTDEELAR